MRRRTILAPLAILLSCCTLSGEPARKRALLIGINDYSASRLTRPPGPPAPPRAWTNLDGAVNDVGYLRGLLLHRYGFDDASIVTLTDQEASRDAILAAIERHLVAPARKNDVLLFFFSGHGSQVRNTRSREADQLDESIVPADSRLGWRDIRDKELAVAFNRVLDRGARLTVILDACHSGSGVRGLDGGLRRRAMKPDLRDIADPLDAPRPEDRGALVLSATQDFDFAYETRDPDGKIHGAFSWALVRAMRDSLPDEPAADTFLRAQARLRAEAPAQDPVIAGPPEARLAPFFGAKGGGPRKQRNLIGITSVLADGTCLLRGGWVDGLTVGSELRIAGRSDVRLEITALHGIAESRARVTGGTARIAGTVRAGALLELVSWAAPPARPLRVWIPRAATDNLAEVRELHAQAARRGIRWVTDPTAEATTHQLRHAGGAWQLVTDGRSHEGRATIADLPATASLFVQLPVPGVLADAIGDVDGVERTRDAQTADYILAGRFVRGRIEYAWVRPRVSAADARRSVLPVRTAWYQADDAALLLRDSLTRLRKVHGWHELQSPGARPQYRLAVRRAENGTLVEDDVLVGTNRYRLVLRKRNSAAAEAVYSRFVHVFVIDSHGNSVLLFPLPARGSVENRLPITPTPGEPLRNPPEEIALSSTSSFKVTEPYGIDSYFILTTDEPLPTLASLQWDGVRAPSSQPRNPLEELLAQTLSGSRGDGPAPIRTSPDWSIEKVTFESVPSRRTTP